MRWPASSLQQSQRGWGEVDKSITFLQDEIDIFSAGLNVDQEYIELREDEEVCMLRDLGAWIAKRVVEAQQTHFEAFKTKIKQHKPGWDSRLKKLKQKLASIMVLLY